MSEFDSIDTYSRDGYNNKVTDEQGNPMFKLGDEWVAEDVFNDIMGKAIDKYNEEQKARANEPDTIDELLRVEQFIPTVDYSQSTGDLVNIRKIRMLAEAPDSGFPTGLFPSSGPLSDMIDYLLAYTGHCNPVLALGGAISTFAALLGGLIESPTHLRTNLYIMLIAPSGTGKTQTFKAIYKLLNPLDPYLVRTTRFASSVAIERSFYREPDDDSDVPTDRAPFCRTLYCIDEFHRYLDAANNPRAPQYLRGIADTFKEVYTNTTIGNSSSSSDKTNRFRYRWHNMHILAASNPYEFWKSCSGTDATGGLLPRFLLFDSTLFNPGELLTRVNTGIPAELLEFCKLIASHKLALIPDFQGSITREPKFTDYMIFPYICEYTPEADKKLEFIHGWYTLKERTCNAKASKEESIRGAFLKRVWEITTKLAMIHAVCRSGKVEGLMVDAKDVDWAEKVSVWSLNQLGHASSSRIADTYDEQMLNEVKKMIQAECVTRMKAGKSFSCSKSRLVQRAKIRVDKIEPLINSLLVSRDIIMVNRNSYRITTKQERESE